MSTMKAIRCPEDLEVALSRIEELFDAKEGTPEDDELSALFALVEAHEAETVSIPLPDPIAAIKFRMDQAGLTRRVLIPILGSQATVSEVLSRGTRPHHEDGTRPPRQPRNPRGGPVAGYRHPVRQLMQTHGIEVVTSLPRTCLACAAIPMSAAQAASATCRMACCHPHQDRV